MKTMRYREAISEAIFEEMSRDDKVFVVGEDVQAGSFGNTAGLVQTFGTKRVRDTPLAETAVAGAAVGSAMAGYRPIADMMFGDFMFIAGDEIFIKAAKWRFLHGGKVDLPLVFMAAIGGYARIGDIHYCTLRAMVEKPTLKNNAYAIVTVDKSDRLRLEGFGRQKYVAFA